MRKLRVPLPANNSTELLVLAKAILAKHLLDGANSVLNHVDWLALKDAIDKADAYHVEAENLRHQSAQRVTDRNIVLEDVLTGVRGVRDILTALNIHNMKNLTDWGFDVIESLSPAAKARTKKKAEEQTPETTKKV